MNGVKCWWMLNLLTPTCGSDIGELMVGEGDIEGSDEEVECLLG